MITAEELRKRQENFRQQDIEKQRASISEKLGRLDHTNIKKLLVSNLYPEIGSELQKNGFTVTFGGGSNEYIISW